MFKLCLMLRMVDTVSFEGTRIFFVSSTFGVWILDPFRFRCSELAFACAAQMLMLRAAFFEYSYYTSFCVYHVEDSNSRV